MKEDRSRYRMEVLTPTHPIVSLSVSGGVLLYSLGWLPIHDSPALASSEGMMNCPLDVSFLTHQDRVVA